MRYNLIKTPKADKEKIRHLMTVLYIHFKDSDEKQNEAKNEKNKRKSKKLWDESYKEWDDAEKYLKSYIKELFRQNRFN